MAQKQDTKHKVRLGKWGENCACEYLVTHGMSVVGQNVRSPYGEIDIILMDGSTTVFVEVKTRSNARSGYPEDAITPEKMKHLDESSRWYIDQHPEIGDNWRVDVVTVVGHPESRKTPLIDWWQNEF